MREVEAGGDLFGGEDLPITVENSPEREIVESASRGSMGT